MKDASLPITLIVVGLIGLAWYFRFFPDVDWVVALGLIAGGIAILALEGINRNSIVTGPMLIATGIAWALHAQYRVSWSLSIPTLLIVAGVLMLIARRPSIPERRGSSRRSLPPTTGEGRDSGA